MVDLTKILIAILDLLAMLITYKLVPLIKAKTTAEQQKKIDAAIRVAVFAAEQLYGAGQGDAKLNFAISYLRGKGFDIDRAQIEAAVYNELNYTGLLNGATINVKPEKELAKDPE